MQQRTAAILLMAGVLAAAPALADTYFGFAIGTANAPRPPVLALHGAPRVVVVPSTRVSRLMEPGDLDVFRFGGTWYAYAAGYWYLSSDVRGPFHVIDAQYVPRAVLFVPPAWWKHHPEAARLGRSGGSGTAVHAPRGARVAIVAAATVPDRPPAIEARRSKAASSKRAAAPASVRHGASVDSSIGRQSDARSLVKKHPPARRAALSDSSKH